MTDAPFEGAPKGLRRIRALEVSDLTVAFLLVPGLFPRNRMFAVHEQPNVKRAKRRAATLRGIQLELERLLGNAKGALEVRMIDGGVILSYARPEMDYRRRAVLSGAEADALATMLEKRGFSAPWEFDRSGVSQAMDRLRAASGVAMFESGAPPR